MKSSALTAANETTQTEKASIVAYALPRPRGDNNKRVISNSDFTINDVPLGASVTFTDFDGAILFAGAFERIQEEEFAQDAAVYCLSLADLDLRERELISAIEQDKIVIFLLPHLPKHLGVREVRPHSDLFRRIADKVKLGWDCLGQPSPMVESVVPEFSAYVRRFGTGYLTLGFDKDRAELWKPLCSHGGRLFGLAFAGKIFFLPSPVPQTQDIVNEIVSLATAAVLAYRKRMSTLMPNWVSDFVFSAEMHLKNELSKIQKQALKLEGEISVYAKWKRSLCLQSDPLVEVVKQILATYFGIVLTVDDKCIEDATLFDESAKILAVFEIKGVKGNFTRNNVNQVDSHRERLGLSSSTPGVLIMNTMMSANSLADKNERPHPDIIKKAAADSVLLVRTLDLLRYAEAVESGLLPKEGLLHTMLNEAGWLKVEDNKAEVVRG